MAVTQARKTKTFDNGRYPVTGSVQKAGTIIYKGTMAMHVNGVFQPAASGVSGAVYAGIAEDTYDSSTQGADYTWSTPMVFKRLAGGLDGKSGDLPTVADLGQLIPVEDGVTVKHTAVSNDVTVRLLSIEGASYIVEPA